MRNIVGFLLVAYTCVGCKGTDTSGPRVQQLIDEYAPTLKLGERISDDARRKYKLRDSAYIGFSDPTYIGPEGLKDLYVMMNPAPGDASNEVVSPSAVIEAISLQTQGNQTTKQLDQRIRTVLGAPIIACHPDGYGRFLENSYWPDMNDRGVQILKVLSVPDRRLQTGSTSYYVVGSAVITFGAKPLSTDHVRLEPCPQ